MQRRRHLLQNYFFVVDFHVTVSHCLCLSGVKTTKTHFYSLLLITTFESHIRICSAAVLLWTSTHMYVRVSSLWTLRVKDVSVEARHVRVCLAEGLRSRARPRWRAVTEPQTEDRAALRGAAHLFTELFPWQLGSSYQRARLELYLQCALMTALPRRQGSQCVTLTHCLGALLQTAAVPHKSKCSNKRVATIQAGPDRLRSAFWFYMTRLRIESGATQKLTHPYIHTHKQWHSA